MDNGASASASPIDYSCLPGLLVIFPVSKEIRPFLPRWGPLGYWVLTHVHAVFKSGRRSNLLTGNITLGPQRDMSSNRSQAPRLLP